MSIDSVSSASASGASSAASVDSEYEQIKKKLAALGISSSGDKATDKAKLEKFESEMKAQQEKEAQKDNEAQKAQAASGAAQVPAEWQTLLSQVGITSSGDIDTDYNKALSIVQEKLATTQTESDKEKYRSLKSQLDSFVTQNSATSAAANTAKVGSSSLAELNKQLLLG